MIIEVDKDMYRKIQSYADKQNVPVDVITQSAFKTYFIMMDKFGPEATLEILQMRTETNTKK